MKNVLCLGMCLVLIVAMTGAAFADVRIRPCYMYVDEIRAHLSIQAGTAKVSGSVFPSGGFRTTVIVRLQRESSTGLWTTIDTWSGSNRSGRSEAGGTKTLICGHNYRVCVTGKVYDENGTLLETVSKYSATKAY